jgi:CRISPR-associated protein Cas5d
MKVERVSYDVITPSAARAIFDAILWKPAIRWQVRRIEVCAPIRWTSVRRNEVGAVVSTSVVRQAMAGRATVLGLNIEDERQQRAALVLKDVRYRLHAQFERVSAAKHRSNFPALSGRFDDIENEAQCSDPETDGKYAAMFERRARRGQSFHQPYLGTREFACRFRLVDPQTEVFETPDELRGERDLDWMLYDLDFGPYPHATPRPRFYRPHLRDGVIQVPAFDSPEVRT